MNGRRVAKIDLLRAEGRALEGGVRSNRHGSGRRTLSTRIRRAAALLRRSWDVLNVAAALHLRCIELVAADERQLEVARVVGVDVIDPGKRPARARCR